MARSPAGIAVPAALQVVPRLEPGEIAQSTIDLAGYLRRQGWRAFVASAGGSLERELAAAGATHVKLPVDQAGSFARWLNAGRLRRAMRRHGIRLVHARAAGPAWSAARAARAVGAAFVTTCHEVAPAEGSPDERLWSRALARGERVLTVSDFVAGELADRFKVEPQRLRLVRPGIDLAEFDPGRVRGHRIANLAERWGIAPRERVVLVPGGLHPRHGHLLLLEAATGLAHRDFTLLFLTGDEPNESYAREVLARARALCLDGRVRFGGGALDLPATIALAEIVALPALSPDPSGLVAAAAQAMGRPVIVTDLGALAESVLPAATGWLVPAGDAGELGRALDLGLAMGGAVRERLARRARAFVAEQFDIEAAGARTIEVYLELLRRPHASTASDLPHHIATLSDWVSRHGT